MTEWRNVCLLVAKQVRIHEQASQATMATYEELEAKVGELESLIHQQRKFISMLQKTIVFLRRQLKNFVISESIISSFACLRL